MFAGFSESIPVALVDSAFIIPEPSALAGVALGLFALRRPAGRRRVA